MFALRAFGIKFPDWADWKRVALVGFLLLSCANALIAFAEQHVDSGFAALMVNSGPFLFVGFSAMAGERVPRLAWTGLAVGFLGIFILTGGPLLNLLRGDNSLVTPGFWGAIGALTAASILWSFGSFLSGKRPVKCHPLMTAAAQSAAGGIGGFVIAAFTGELFHAHAPSAASVYAVCFLVVVGSWLGYVSYVYCLQNLPSHSTATTTYLNMVVAIFVGWLFLSETITPVKLVGGAVTLLGVYIVNQAKEKKPV